MLDSRWAAALDSFLDEADGWRRRELSYLVDRRNKISHGQSETVGRRKALDLTAMALEVSDWLANCLNPDNP
ncbi:MAG: hypothetical protein ACRCYU_07445 [Nocardioides sp.]